MRLVRILLGIVGLLVALFAGGCAAILYGQMLFDPFQRSYVDASGIAIVAIVGVLPAALGGALAWWGLKPRKGTRS